MFIARKAKEDKDYNKDLLDCQQHVCLPYHILIGVRPVL